MNNIRMCVNSCKLTRTISETLKILSPTMADFFLKNIDRRYLAPSEKEERERSGFGGSLSTSAAFLGVARVKQAKTSGGIHQKFPLSVFTFTGEKKGTFPPFRKDQKSLILGTSAGLKSGDRRISTNASKVVSV